MTPEKLFHQMLGLGLEWEVIGCQFDEGAGVVSLEIRETPNLWSKLRCQRDGGPLSCYDHTEALEWRHLNVFEHRCHIRCRLPRSKCAQCGQVLRVRPPWEGLSKHFTQAFEAFALLLIREMPMARAAKIMGERDTRLWRLAAAHVSAARAQLSMDDVICVGVDEMSIRKGHHYITVFADLLQRRVLFGVEGKGFEVWGHFIEDLGRHDGHQHALVEVSMDMSAPYQKGVAEYCRNARVVFDKYHVVAQINAAVDQTRKAESSGGLEASQKLRRSRWLWRKNPETLSAPEKQRLNELMRTGLWTAQAYQMRLALQAIYQEEQKEIAREKFTAWCQWVRATAQKAPKVIFGRMVGAAKMIEKHMEGILGHWTRRLTNAFMEGLNSVFSATKRKARGYRSTEYLLLMLYLVAGKLKLPQKPTATH